MKVKTAIKRAPIHIAAGIFFLLLGVGVYYSIENSFFKLVSLITSIVCAFGIIVEIVNVIYLKKKARKNSGYLEEKLY